MLDNYPETFTLVQIHLDGYAIPWGYSRANFYPIQYTPTTWFDGLLSHVGSSNLINLYNIRAGVPTDVTIELFGDPAGGTIYDITAKVCLEAGGTAKTARVHIVQVLDKWPIPPSYSRNGLKIAANSVDVALTPGGCQEVVKTFTFDSGSWSNKENIKIIAWAQEKLDSSPAEVYQAANMGWPFLPSGLAGDFDDDDDVDLDDYYAFVDCFTGPDGGPIPPECLRGDFDFDGDIDCDDWDQFVLAWTEPGDPPDYGVCSCPPPLSAPAPYNVLKNRYISFVPNHGGYTTAYQVEMTSSNYFPSVVGVIGWVGQPDENDVCRVVAEPFFSDSWPAVAHVGDCGIVPAAGYEIRASVDGTFLTEAVAMGTIIEPIPKKWGDVVGLFLGEEWTGPNAEVNFDDIQAAIQTFQVLDSAPHFTWVDIDARVPNVVVNFTDIMRIVQGFQGEDYPFGCPGDPCYEHGGDPTNCP